MISNADAAQIIREVRSIPWYQDRIQELNQSIKAIEFELDREKPVFKDPLDMPTVIINGKEEKYKVPGSKYPSFSKRVEYDSLDEFTEKRDHYQRCLKWAVKYRKALYEGEDADFMRDFIEYMPYEGLRNKYHYVHPARHAKSVIRQKIKEL